MSVTHMTTLTQLRAVRIRIRTFLPATASVGPVKLYKSSGDDDEGRWLQPLCDKFDENSHFHPRKTYATVGEKRRKNNKSIVK